MRLKKLLQVVIASGMVIGASIPAYAEINGNEAELLAIINSTREYNGTTYQVSSAYKKAAYNYLNSPDVNCTDEQKAQAMSQMFGSIQQGIDEGYLIPVGENAATPETEAETVPSVEQVTPEQKEQLEQAVASGQISPEQLEAMKQQKSAAESAQIVPEEIAPSPIVIALENAMNTPVESTETKEEGSLLPTIHYPDQLIRIAAIGVFVLSVISVGISAALGLFHHSKRKKRARD